MRDWVLNTYRLRSRLRCWYGPYPPTCYSYTPVFKAFDCRNATPLCMCCWCLPRRLHSQRYILGFTAIQAGYYSDLSLADFWELNTRLPKLKSPWMTIGKFWAGSRLRSLLSAL